MSQFFLHRGPLHLRKKRPLDFGESPAVFGESPFDLRRSRLPRKTYDLCWRSARLIFAKVRASSVFRGTSQKSTVLSRCPPQMEQGKLCDMSEVICFACVHEADVWPSVCGVGCGGWVDVVVVESECTCVSVDAYVFNILKNRQ